MNFQIQIYEPRHIIDLMPEDVEDVTEQRIVISGKILGKCANYIRDNAVDGEFNEEFTIEHDEEVVNFNVYCRLFYRDPDDHLKVTGVEIYNAYAETTRENGEDIPNDFTEKELEYFIMN